MEEKKIPWYMFSIDTSFPQIFLICDQFNPPEVESTDGGLSFPLHKYLRMEWLDRMVGMF
jgi:hypothetical protein